MQLLERQAPMASLTEYARQASAGEGRLVLLAGEAGVGKSVLLQQLERELLAARWSWGACDGLFTPRPLGPLFDLGGQLGGELAEQCRAGAAREDLFAALLRQVSEPGTLDVVVIEDLHWADEATVDLLRFLGRRLRDAALLLIASYRDDGLTAADPLRVALGDLAAHQSTRRVMLAPLSPDAVGVLASGSGLPPAELYQLTGGNPFYVTEVIQAGMDEVPASARDAVLARAARLSGQARDVLDAAALTGSRLELQLLELVTGGQPAAVDELLESGLLTADGRWLRFRHEIARLAVERAVGAQRRGAVHARILAALQSMGCDDDARLAFHAEAAGDGQAVLRYAPAAARRAAELASHREAAAQLERALRFAGRADPALAAQLYDALAGEQALIDHWQDAGEAGGSALALWRQLGDRLREGDTTRRLSRTMWRLCRGSEAAAAALDAVSILEPLGPSTELAWAYANLAFLRMTACEHLEAIELARRAQAIAEPLQAAAVLSDALNTEGCAINALGQEWVPQLRRALQIALDAGLEGQAGRAYSNSYSMYVSQRRFAEAELLFAEGLGYCEDHDVSTFVSCLLGVRVWALEQAGQWDESVALCRRLLENGGASPVNRIGPLLSLGRILVRRGDPGGWEYLDEATAAALGTGEPSQVMCVRLARAEAHWLAGRSAAALAEAELADDVCARCDSWERGEVSEWLSRTGSARAPRGDLAGPYRWMADGDCGRAAQAWTDLGCPFSAALALQDGTTEAPLRAALRIFDELGAAAAARITRRKMRLLGVQSIPAGPRSATRAHPLRLTRREREVLDLICAGRTNAEIATQLFISTKTVDHHVSAVLGKLGAPNRRLAASRAVRLGLAPAGRKLGSAAAESG